VQTNEVRRCSYLLPAVTLAARLAAPAPLALIEAGASARLNLGLDGYAYDYGTGTIAGDPRSQLTLQCELRGGTPPPLARPARPPDTAICVMHTAFLAHLAPPDRARFEHQVAALSAGRPVYRISAETRAEPRLHLATCVNGTVADQQALARYQSHGAWLEWTASSTTQYAAG
jgi:hypothetical protein